MPDVPPAPLPESAALAGFRSLLSGAPPTGAGISALLSALEKAGDLELAYRLLKQERPLARHGQEGDWRILHRAFQVRVDLARHRRMDTWQHDPRRRTLRFRFEVGPPATRLNPGALQAALSNLLTASGLPLAMGLEKTPRPVVRLGHPLPLGVEGLGEWAEAVLKAPSPIPLEDLPAFLGPHCPEGIRFLQAFEVPNHASPVLELCRRSCWCWTCPAELLEEARARVDAFLAAEHFELEKSGKVAGHKAIKRVEVRHLVEGARWSGADLAFETRIAPGEALNPARLLGAILGRDAALPGRLVRTGVDLAEDPRLQRPETFEPKLSNLYEDAVVLHAGPSLVLHEDEDDEPLLLGS